MRLWPFTRSPGGPRRPGPGAGDGWWAVAPIVPVAARTPLPVAAPVHTVPHVAGARTLVPLAAPVGPPPGPGTRSPSADGAATRFASEPPRERLLVPPAGASPVPEPADPGTAPEPWPAPPEAGGGGQDLAGVIAMLDAQVARSRPPGADPRPETAGTPTMLRPTLAESRRRGLGVGTHAGEDPGDGASPPPTTATPSAAGPRAAGPPPTPAARPPQPGIGTAAAPTPAASTTRPAPDGPTRDEGGAPVRPAARAQAQPSPARPPDAPRTEATPGPDAPAPPRAPIRAPAPASPLVTPGADAPLPPDEGVPTQLHPSRPADPGAAPAPAERPASPTPLSGPRAAETAPAPDSFSPEPLPAPGAEEPPPASPAPAPTRIRPLAFRAAPPTTEVAAGPFARQPAELAAVEPPPAEPQPAQHSPDGRTLEAYAPDQPAPHPEPQDPEPEDPGARQPESPDAAPAPARADRTPATPGADPAAPVPRPEAARPGADPSGDPGAGDGPVDPPAGEPPPRPSRESAPVREAATVPASRPPGAPPRPVVTRADPMTVATFGRLTGVDLGFVPVVRSPETGREAAVRSSRAFTASGVVHLPDDTGPADRGDTAALLGHELTHVLQQRALGALADEAGPFGDRLEAEARDVERALRGEHPAPDPDTWSWTEAGASPYRSWTPDHGFADAAPVPVSAAVQRAPLAEGPTTPDPERGSEAPEPLPAPMTDESQPLVYPDEPEPAQAQDETEPEAAPPPLTAEDVERLVERMQPGVVPPELDLTDPGLLDALALGLYGRLRHQLRNELIADRERAGCLTEFH